MFFYFSNVEPCNYMYLVLSRLLVESSVLWSGPWHIPIVDLQLVLVIFLFIIVVEVAVVVVAMVVVESVIVAVVMIITLNCHH